MAKIITYIIFTQIASNGYWYWFTSGIKFKETPLTLIPILATFACIMSLGVWIFYKWDE